MTTKRKDEPEIVIPPEPVNNPFVEAPPPPPPPPERELTKEEEKAAKEAAAEAKRIADARAKAIEAKRKENEKIAVSVRAIRRGFYPADGRIRNPGEIFDYIPLKDADGNLEEKLPSWMQDVDGDMETRAVGEESGTLPETTLIEVSGVKGDNVTVRKGTATRKVI